MKDQKMSKSLGNVVTARAFMDKYHPEILKYLFLSAHYRSMLTVDDDKIFQVITALDRIYNSLELANDVINSVEEKADPESGFVKKLEALQGKIKKSLNDDLNSAEYISQIFEAVRAFNALGFKNKKWNAIHKANSQFFHNWMMEWGGFGALFQEKPTEMLNRLDEIVLTEKNLDKNKIEILVQERIKARENKEWAESDRIRDELAVLGIEVHDGGKRAWSVKKSS